MVSHADISISRMAGGTDCGSGGLLCINAPCRSQCSLAATSGMVLRVDYVLQRSGTHLGHYPRAHAGRDHGRASSAWILFVSVSIYWIAVADHAFMADAIEEACQFASAHIGPDPLLRRQGFGTDFWQIEGDSFRGRFAGRTSVRPYTSENSSCLRCWRASRRSARRWSNWCSTPAACKPRLRSAKPLRRLRGCSGRPSFLPDSS